MNAITITDTRHTYANEYPSIGGIGGYRYQEETSYVQWSDGTRLVVEGYYATAAYRGQTYRMPRLNTTDHDTIVARWTVAIGQRLQRDVPSTRLQDRVRNWRTEWPAA